MYVRILCANFTAAAISPYRLDAEHTRDVFDSLQDRRFVSYTGAVSQGLTKDIVFLNIGCTGRFTKWVGDSRELLVELTRARYGLVILMDEKALDYTSYDFPSEVNMVKSKQTKTLYQIYSLTKDLGVLCKIQAPDVTICRNYGEVGHRARDCDSESRLICHNCCEVGHSDRKSVV